MKKSELRKIILECIEELKEVTSIEINNNGKKWMSKIKNGKTVMMGKEKFTAEEKPNKMGEFMAVPFEGGDEYDSAPPTGLHVNDITGVK